MGIIIINQEKPIIFFDGVCSLCNKFINLLFRLDTKNKFLVSPIQGETFKKIIISEDDKKIDSIALWQNGHLYFKYSAVVRIISSLGGVWCVFKVFHIIPLKLGDFFYDIVAKNRYAWFGKKNSCRLPTASERAKFLD